jgi:hypothetical protein
MIIIIAETGTDVPITHYKFSHLRLLAWWSETVAEPATYNFDVMCIIRNLCFNYIGQKRNIFNGISDFTCT